MRSLWLGLSGVGCVQTPLELIEVIAYGDGPTQAESTGDNLTFYQPVPHNPAFELYFSHEIIQSSVEQRLTVTDASGQELVFRLEPLGLDVLELTFQRPPTGSGNALRLDAGFTSVRSLAAARAVTVGFDVVD